MELRRALLLLLACFVSGCTKPDVRPDVVLITIDTLRADHLGAYGYERSVSPVIDAFASRATVFENAMAPAPHTVPSLLEIMTSKYRQGLELSGENPTLAEVLRDHGYRTGAVVDNALLELDATARGLMRGFDRFYRNGLLDPTPAQQHWKTKTPADCITAQAIRWLKRQDRSGPVFLWLHYFDPHDPYLPPFADDLEALSRKSDSQFTGDIRNTFLFSAPNGEAAQHLPEKDRRHLVELYDAEIRYVDQSLGELFSFLRSEGMYDRSVIVFTADHGESFGEHGIWMHGYSLYGTEVHVPLIVKLPGQVSGAHVASPVQAIDVFPTIVDSARIPMAGLTLDGTDLRQDRSEPAFAFWGPWQRVATTDWTLVQRGDKVELFRARQDPGELHDVAAQEPAVAGSLRASAAAKIAAAGASRQELEKTTSETLERMRALGYLKE